MASHEEKRKRYENGKKTLWETRQQNKAEEVKRQKMGYPRP
jgi:hypothetical protein